MLSIKFIAIASALLPMLDVNPHQVGYDECIQAHLQLDPRITDQHWADILRFCAGDAEQLEEIEE